MKGSKAHSPIKRGASKVMKDYEKEKIDDLLRIIEMNKKTIQEMEVQIKSLQRENYLLKSQSQAR
jgi:hypothetical protein